MRAAAIAGSTLPALPLQVGVGVGAGVGAFVGTAVGVAVGAAVGCGPKEFIGPFSLTS